ncbi:MAG TPA: carboxypeptidase-like regulatory domain-containing protein, partial [Chitinophaga sp.]
MTFTVWCKNRLVTLCLLFASLIAASLPASAGNTQSVTLSLKNIPLAKAFKEIQKQTGYSFLYSKEDLEKTQSVNLDVRSQNIESVLNLCFHQQPLTYSIVDKVVIIKRKSGNANANEASPEENLAPAAPPVTGVVLSSDGSPIPGTVVQIKGTNKGTVTDADGHFSLEAPVGATLVIRSVGFDSQEIKVESAGPLKITLRVNTSILEEVIVTAGGIKAKRREVGTATSVIKADALVTGKAVNIAGGLQGKVAGLQINATNGGVDP